MLASRGVWGWSESSRIACQQLKELQDTYNGLVRVAGFSEYSNLIFSVFSGTYARRHPLFLVRPLPASSRISPPRPDPRGLDRTRIQHLEKLPPPIRLQYGAARVQGDGGGVHLS